MFSRIGRVSDKREKVAFFLYQALCLVCFFYYLDEIETHCYHRNTEEEVDRAEGNPCDIFDYWKCCFLRTRNSVCWSIDNVQCQYACTKKGLEGLEVYIVFIACFKGLKEYIIHFPNGIPSQSTDRNFSNQMSEHLVFFQQLITYLCSPSTFFWSGVKSPKPIVVKVMKQKYALNKIDKDYCHNPNILKKPSSYQAFILKSSILKNFNVIIVSRKDFPNVYTYLKKQKRSKQCNKLWGISTWL